MPRPSKRNSFVIPWTFLPTPAALLSGPEAPGFNVAVAYVDNLKLSDPQCAQIVKKLFMTLGDREACADAALLIPARNGHAKLELSHS